MFGLGNKNRGNPRRWAARENRQGYAARNAGTEIPRHDIVPSLAIAGIFCIAITGMFLLRKQVVPYRPGEYVPHDIVARVDFSFFDQARNDQLIQYKRDSVFRDYRRVEGDPWDKIQDFLLALPDTIHGRSPQELDSPLRDLLDSGAITELEQDRIGLDREQYESNVRQFIAYSRKHLLDDDEPLVIIPQDARDEETRLAARYPGEPRQIKLLAPLPDPQNPQATAGEPPRFIDIGDVFGADLPDSFGPRLDEAARVFGLELGPKISRITLAKLASTPNYLYDDQSTHEEQNQAESTISPLDAVESYVRDAVVVTGGTTLSERDFMLLRARTRPTSSGSPAISSTRGKTASAYSWSPGSSPSSLPPMWPDISAAACAITPGHWPWPGFCWPCFCSPSLPASVKNRCLSSASPPPSSPP